ncbi:hypothetical protein BFP97_06450 [Roseivirga sp. 4D4]|nr:hypothetical protein BFP97_06450 [Roseivirga sp. 4D4]
MNELSVIKAVLKYMIIKHIRMTWTSLLNSLHRWAQRLPGGGLKALSFQKSQAKPWQSSEAKGRFF